MWPVLVSILAVIVVYFYLYKPLQYWRKLKVPYITPLPFFENMVQFIVQYETVYGCINKLYHKYHGRALGVYFFNTPILMIKDLNLIKQIGIKDFDHFVDHRPFISEDIDPLFGKNLIALQKALRNWPPSPALDRMCTKSFTIPAEEADGVEVHVHANNLAWIPVFPIHRDPQHYPDPDKFDPERFSDENKDKSNPMAFLPFGIGPRNCIESRFALMEAKVIAVHLLSKFSIVLTDKSQVLLVLQKGTFSLIDEKGMWVGLVKRSTSANIIL